MPRIDELLRAMRDRKGSDLHLVAGLAPRIRASGHLAPIEGCRPLTDPELRTLLSEITTDTQWRSFEDEWELDFAYGLPGVARFRANYFQQENGAGAVFRIIPETILTVDQLDLPQAIRRLAHLSSGLVLVTGPTGSGKSTTMAAVINEINERYVKHIITIEDPIEFVHKNKQSVFSQREVGDHTTSFASALRAAIRQNPDVILVGEMRDRETIELAITAAEMGVLVFGTLHTNNAAKTIDRLVDAFPADEQEQIRLSLSESLAGIVSQLLLRTADGNGRCAANEILLKTSALPNLIREGNTPMLRSLIQGGKSLGMQTMDDALWNLVASRRILPADAYMKAEDKARFEGAGGVVEDA
jgi:twitching motility protein PilT